MFDLIVRMLFVILWMVFKLLDRDVFNLHQRRFPRFLPRFLPVLHIEYPRKKPGEQEAKTARRET
jgi:hypothetical protein